MFKKSQEEIKIYVDRNRKKIVVVWLKDLRVDQWIEPCIRVNTRGLNRELCIGLSTLYTKTPWSMLLL